MTRTELEETAAACGVDLSADTHQADLVRSIIDSIVGKSDAEALATLLHRDVAAAIDGSVISNPSSLTEDSPLSPTGWLRIVRPTRANPGSGNTESRTSWQAAR